MTVEWYDLGQRLRAAHARQPVARLTYAPIVPGHAPVAVRAATDGESVTVTAANADHRAQSATDTDALDLLASLGVSITAPEPATLISDTPETLPALRHLTDLTRPTQPEEATAAHIGWWLGRADYPTGRAVVPLIDTARARWVLGTTPEAEAHASTWRTWLGITDATATGLLDMHRRIAAGEPLTHLSELAEDDLYSWGLAQSEHADLRNWRTRDSRSRAALGLRSRCDAAEVYASALLTDPQHRRRSLHTGHVITGTVATTDRTRVIEIRADRLDARVRPGTDLTGWFGSATADPASTGPGITGTVTDTHTEGETLVLTFKHGVAATPSDGALVTLHALPVTPAGQRWNRRRFGSLYRARRSWLTTGRDPQTTRRDVPLDVLVAGASDD